MENVEPGFVRLRPPNLGGPTDGCPPSSSCGPVVPRQACRDRSARRGGSGQKGFGRTRPCLVDGWAARPQPSPGAQQPLRQLVRRPAFRRAMTNSGLRTAAGRAARRGSGCVRRARSQPGSGSATFRCGKPGRASRPATIRPQCDEPRGSTDAYGRRRSSERRRPGVPGRPRPAAERGPDPQRLGAAGR
jgi:hypothetical protein